MDWYAALLNNYAGGQKALILLVLLVGPLTGSPVYRNSIDTEDSRYVTESSASTVEVLRNMQKLLGLTKSLGTRTKFVKQADQNEAEGAANALAYLTDSFGGQLAGQILSVILSSVTGDVRGILGNSLNLFQTDETRDRVQFFLDEISQNFLKLTGLGALTTTKPPLTQSSSIPLILGPGSGTQVHQINPAQTIPITPLQSGSTLIRPGVPLPPSSSSSSGGQKTQESASGQQQIIYVLPNLNGGSSSSATSGTSGTKTTTGTRVTSNSGDDESEEDRKLWS